MGEQNPLATVVIASYNHAAHVETTIASIASQDYPNVEILVIDDGSTDGSVDHLKCLQNKYSFRLVTRDNGGLVSVLNLAIKGLYGDFVIFHASDDVSPINRISRQVDTLIRYPRAAFTSGNVEFVNNAGKSVGTLRPVNGYDRELEFEDLFLGRATVSSVASMYRIEALRRMGDLDTSFRAEDPQIFWRLTSMGYTWVQTSGAPVINYRMLFTSQSRTIMPELNRDLVRLVEKYADHPRYADAMALAKTSLFSSLSENQKADALNIALGGGVDWLSNAALRGVIKLIMPSRLHWIFKKAGK